MMRKLLIALIVTTLPFLAEAQALKFGYFSRNEVLQAMSDYATARRTVEELRSQYDAEAKRSANDFNTKYEEFLAEQSQLADNIRQKRQAELLDLMQKNQMFKEQSEQLLKSAEKSAMEPVEKRLGSAVKELGEERGYIFIINTDNDALPFINPDNGEDVTTILESKLK